MRAARLSLGVVSLVFAFEVVRPSVCHGAGPSVDVTPIRAACAAAIAREQLRERGVSSREVCHEAFMLGGAAQDLANEAISLLAPERNASLDDLAVATLDAEAAARRAPDQPWGALVRCEIARRLGSADGLEACHKELARVAPTHAATRAELARPATSTSLFVWLARCLVLFALTGTLAHMLARRRWPVGATRVSLVALGCLVSALAGRPAHAIEAKASLSKITIDDANPKTSIPSLADQQTWPLEFGYFLQDLLARATEAWKTGDHARAARYYEALTIAAPKAAYGPGKWCEELEASHDYTQAIVACRTAITRGGATAGDYARFVNVVLESDKPLPALEHKELDNVLAHLDAEGQGLGAMPAMLRCEVAARYHDVAELETCTRALAKSAPFDQKTILYQWSLAIEKHDDASAAALVDRARGAGMPPAGLAQMQRTTSELGRKRMGRFILAGLAFVMFVLAARSGLRWLATRRRLASL